MAERRMFSKTIIDSDAFLDMPLSAQSLYFHLSMRADDDGFINNPRKIQRMIGAADDDLRILTMRKFIIPFETGIVVIKHWKIHNYIQKDRYKPTVYQEELAALADGGNKGYTLAEQSGYKPDTGMDTPCIQSGTRPDTGMDTGADTTCIHRGHDSDTQVRLGKDRLGKVRKEKGGTGGETADKPPAPPPSPDRPEVPYERIKDLYNELCPSLRRCTILSDARKRAIRARFSSGYTLEDFERLFRTAEASSFLRGSNKRNWQASFDWLIRDDKMAKTLDGNFDDQNGQASGPPEYGPPTDFFT